MFFIRLMPAKERVLQLFVFTVFVVLFACPAFAKDKIIWVDVDAPPFYILEGNEKGKGVVDEITLLLQKNMPQYDHEHQVINLSRLMYMMRNGEHVCHAALFRTRERETEALFSSTPTDIVPPVGITIKADRKDDFPDHDNCSLAELLEKKKLKAGIAADRSYGKPLDDILKRNEGSPLVYARSGADIYSGLLRMLLAGRVDFILGSPLEAGYIHKKMDVGDSVINIPIRENMEYTMGYAACPKNEWGRGVIAEIEKILKERRNTDEYRDIFEKWLDKGSIDRFRKAYSEHFLKEP